MNPQDILVLGLGGGSLVKFCYRYLARAQIDVVENNADVMALRREFAVPQNDARLRVVEDDAGQFVAGAARRQYDVVFSDAFDRHGLAPTLCERDFYDALRTRLRPTGIVVANIAGLKDERAGYIRLLSESFGDNMLVVEVEEDDNEVVFAFKDPMFEPRWRWMERQAAAMERRYNVEFPRFVRALRRGRRNVMPPASMVEG
jgi:spermidine synthase